MAISQDLSITIVRSAEVVFDRLVDVGSWPQWLIASGILRVVGPGESAEPPQPLAAGDAFVIEQRLAGVRDARIEATVVALERPERFAVRGRDADGITIDIEARIEPTDADADPAVGNRCRLDWRLRIGLPLRYRMFESMAAPQVRRAAALDLEAFRIRLEAPSPD